MIQFDAKYFDGKHPLAKSITVLVSASGNTKCVGENFIYECRWQEIDISGQLGRTARTLTFPDGSMCESTEHAQINALQKKFSRSSGALWLHGLESSWRYVLLVTIVVIAVTAGMVIYGIPALANTVAHALPASVDKQLSRGTLSILDKHVLEKSDLSDQQQQHLQSMLADITASIDDQHQYRLLVRKGIGPNAFALPSGEIVITDELVELADNDQQITAVLVHEIGHVIHKHGLRSVLQSSVVALLLTAVTGDISSSSGFAAAMPIILLEARYSRKFEWEADQFALNYMRTNNIDRHEFATILTKISGVEEDDSGMFNYLSTHPSTRERIQPFLSHDSRP